jgi:hypothetical protein
MSHQRSFILTFFVLLLLAGCGLDSEQRGRQPSADWSRGMPVGDGATGTAGMAVSPDGDSLYAVWPKLEGQDTLLHFERLSPTGLTLAEQDLEMPAGQIRMPRLLSSGEALLLFWEQRAGGERDWSLWYAPLTEAGEMAGEPIRLSTPGMDAGDYALAVTAGSDAVVAWEDQNGERLVALNLSENMPIELATGSAPSLAAGTDGRLYIAWWNDSIYFAPLPQPLAVVTPSLVGSVSRQFGDTEIEPVLGIAGERAYVLWAIFSQSGLEAGTGRTEYVTFPLEQPASQQPRQIWILSDEFQETQRYSSAYAITELVPYPASPAGTTRFTGEPAVTAGRGDELALVVSFDQAWRQQMQKQMAVVLFADGAPQGYLPAVKTAGFSAAGNLGSDEEGNLYLLWQEGAGGLDLYYATTAADAREEINSLNSGDVANLALNAFFEGVVGLLFFPLALIWMAPGLILLGLYHMRHETESLERQTSRLLLLAALAGYEVAKVLFMPAILSYVPFSAWLDIGEGSGRVLQVITPIITLGLGAAAAELLRRRRGSVSTAFYYFVMVAVDAVLTLLVYGVNFIGVF